MSWWDFPFDPLAAIVLAVVFTVPFLIGGAVLELRHYRRLEQMAAEVSAIRLLSAPRVAVGAGVECAGVVGLGLVSVGVTLAPPPLGQLMVRFRKLVGGNIPLYERLADRARREALLRLRTQVYALGGNGAVGVRLTAVGMGGGRINVLAYGTAVRGLPADDTAIALVPEAAGSPPAPPRRRLAVLIAIAATLAGVGALSGFAVTWITNDFAFFRRMRQRILRF